MNIAIGLPTPEFVSAHFAFENLPAIISNIKSLGHNAFLSCQDGVRTDKNRNTLLQRFIEMGNIDYVLWLDVDMLYPPDMVTKYLEHDFDVIGCLYFKRAEPFAPVAYNRTNRNPFKPYTVINIDDLPEDNVVLVDGLGYGGMMVKMSVYEALGDDKWTKYGENFHLPYEAEDRITHDLIFCQQAQNKGFRLLLHSGVRPGHLSTQVITQENWLRSRDAHKKRA